MRPGTYLRGEEGLPLPPVPDLSAPEEAPMLAEVARHFTRMGQLDAIAEVMMAARDKDGLEHFVEVVRRERQRHFAAMRRFARLRRLAWRVEVE